VLVLSASMGSLSPRSLVNAERALIPTPFAQSTYSLGRGSCFFC
jgi:hypothetical protein